MGRKLFTRHIAEAAASPPQHISGVENVEEGLVAFQYSHLKDKSQISYNIRLLALDVAEYPDGNTYMLYTEDDKVDPGILQTFEILNSLIGGNPLPEALLEISRGLDDALTRGQADNPIAIDEESTESDVDDFLDGAEYDDDDFNLDDDPKPTITSTRIASIADRSRDNSSDSPTLKIKSDLKAAKAAGFRIGVIGDLSAGGIVSVSIRVSKLGISEEAMQAWSLNRKHYLVLLIRFQQGYRDLDQIKGDSTVSGLTEMRVNLCTRYKPGSKAAYEAFNLADQKRSSSSTSGCNLEPLFIGSPLNDLLRERFAKIVNFRESCGFNWPSAEAFINDVQGKALGAAQTNIDDYYLPDDTQNKAFAPIITADALDGVLCKNASLPLVAMQFVLRHLVRCTEFCLVCHCKVGDTFEALKPYVCSRPLCLYQYMALGFGPSIEWELLSQPYVVDLLISFCYSAAKHERLKEFPNGIDLRVPLLDYHKHPLTNLSHYRGRTLPAADAATHLPGQPTPAKLDFDRKELIFEAAQHEKTAKLRNGDWILIQSEDLDDDIHARVELAMFPTIKLHSLIHVHSRTKAANKLVSDPPYSMGYVPPVRQPTRASTPPKVKPKGVVAVNCYSYDKSFDDLSDGQKQNSITTLLDTLPPVLEMQNYLEVDQQGREPNLKAWRSRISESALNLMRWVIASNRSCIMQVDRLVQDNSNSKVVHAVDDRVAGMDDWMQFRFAQGAPDKEQRFVDCVKKESIAAEKKHPTSFAWHGSPISNWHSIIRQGLIWEGPALHGRAYGNGVYMSNNASTSMGYTAGGYGEYSKGGSGWSNSVLRISSAFSLNEVVNMPEKFVSRTPHYVVKDIDWIQARYLFVKSELHHTVGGKPTIEYEQDPLMTAFNDKMTKIQIPITAVSKSRRPATVSSASKTGDKKLKSVAVTDQATAEKQEDDADSLISDEEDQAFLEPEPEDFDNMSLDDDDEFYEIPDPGPAPPPPPTKKRGLDASQTDFVPGSLDVSTIKFLEPPKDATASATKHLMKWFKEAIKEQEATPLHELGWYINPEHMSNMYQWIVEMHSFKEKLPLAKDMKSAGIKSIVMEMRFTNQFPFAPPFIRVVKPRFLPFNQGGGGHVTEGGALCMELLTNSGWSAVTSLEMVLMQVKLALEEEERPARLLGSRMHYGGGVSSYGVGEAVIAYERACRAHGWAVPEGFNKFQQEET